MAGATAICPGCSALVEDRPGQPHPYIGANSGCWDLYGQILAKEYGEYQYPELTHRLTVDTYAIQHPGVSQRQSIQSVNGHLVSLYFVLVRNLSGKAATQKISEILKQEPAFIWLDPPIPNGRKTVLDVLKATNQEEHERNVRVWADDVWSCWSAKHGETIQQIIDDYF